MMITPIHFFYNIINRNAIVIKAKKPFLDWVNHFYPDKPIDKLEDSNIYLIREHFSIEDIENWIKKNFDKIFKNELNDWHTDDKNWPKKRSYQLFRDWFEFEIHSMVLDIEESEITKE